MIEIEARRLTKTFGKFAAVRGLNLHVPRGTIFGFLGPNGSGKSTTVKMLTGLLKPTAGEVLVAGEPITVENTELKRKIGVLPEENALFHGLTICEHLEMNAGRTLEDIYFQFAGKPIMEELSWLG